MARRKQTFEIFIELLAKIVMSFLLFIVCIAYIGFYFYLSLMKYSITKEHTLVLYVAIALLVALAVYAIGKEAVAAGFDAVKKKFL